MNIFIPLGGKGERFVKNGYTAPKPLIKIFEKTMIEYVLDNLKINEDVKVFIIYDSKLNEYNFSEFIHNKYSHINFVEVKNTKGAAETLYFGIDYILQNYQYHIFFWPFLI
jgi:NDP-sugar pyrophosphorylase family protein